VGHLALHNREQENGAVTGETSQTNEAEPKKGRTEKKEWGLKNVVLGGRAWRASLLF